MTETTEEKGGRLVAEVRIVTPCPSCNGRTLFVSPGGHLTCSFIGCKRPSVEAMFEWMLGKQQETLVKLKELLTTVNEIRAKFGLPPVEGIS